MAEIPYSKREIDMQHEGLVSQMNTMEEKLDQILVQVKYTNGKVQKLIIAVVSIVALLVGLGFKEVLQVLSLLSI